MGHYECGHGFGEVEKQNEKVLVDDETMIAWGRGCKNSSHSRRW